MRHLQISHYIKNPYKTFAAKLWLYSRLVFINEMQYLLVTKCQDGEMLFATRRLKFTFYYSVGYY